jgi:hypothetical protein
MSVATVLRKLCEMSGTPVVADFAPLAGEVVGVAQGAGRGREDDELLPEVRQVPTPVSRNPGWRSSSSMCLIL